MNLLDFLIPAAHAQAAGAAPAAGGGFGFLILLIPIAMMFFMFRQQSKRQKEQKALLENLSKGDEVLTNGGIAGTVTGIGDSFISVEVATGVEIRVQKGAIANVLPKGTLKSAV